MSDAVTMRIPAVAAMAQRIRRTAAAADPGVVALVLLAALPWLLGWTARLAWRVVWLVLSHLGAAVVVGWRAAAPERRDAP